MAALIHDPKRSCVDLPAGTVLTAQKEQRLGLIDVISGRRAYSVLAADILRKCEPLPAS